jgi:hypothetical protein
MRRAAADCLGPAGVGWVKAIKAIKAAGTGTDHLAHFRSSGPTRMCDFV